MEKYTFTQNSLDDDGEFDGVYTASKITEAEQLFDVIQAMEEFLRGCGFIFDGHLDIVPDEEETGWNCTYDECDDGKTDPQINCNDSLEEQERKLLITIFTR